MGNYQADQTVVKIVQRKQAKPLIKHEKFIGKLVKLNDEISCLKNCEREALEHVQKALKWIELTLEWCKLADDQEEIARNREQLEIKNEEVMS